MKSAQLRGYGSGDVIENNRNAPVPNDPSEGKVLVKINAAGVNPVDWKIREGYVQQVIPLKFPSPFGLDFSGSVQKVGAGVSGRNVHDEVYGQASVMSGGLGAFAEMALASAFSAMERFRSDLGC